MHIMSILCSSADAISSGSCPILFKILTLNVAICSVCLHFSSFDCLSSVADFSNTEARAPTSAGHDPRHAGHSWKNKDVLISDVLLWTPTYGRAKAGRPAQTYIQQLCEDTGCSSKDLPEAMNDREKWREGQGYPC